MRRQENEEGRNVRGEEFYITVTPDKRNAITSTYNDHDNDGIIYIVDIDGGDYIVALEEIEGYYTEKESINVNELTAKMVFASGKYVPYGMEIQSVNDNRVMEFKNMNGAYIGSMYTYSNFELTFDVIGLQRVSEFDENGNEIVPKNDNIVVSFGDGDMRHLRMQLYFTMTHRFIQ